MEDISELRLIKRRLAITPSNFNRYKEYIYEKILELKGYVLDEEYGFLQDIVEIKSIKQYDINRQTFDGSMIFEVEFLAKTITIKRNNTYKMKVIKVDNSKDILLTNNGPIISIIKNYAEVDEVYKQGDVVDVEIEGFEYNYKQKVIKTVGKLV